MIIIPHKNFKKKFKKIRKSEQKKFEQKIDIFLANQFDSILNNHKLHGKLKNYRSINITSDLRVVYQEIKKDMIFLIDIDSHSNLYS